MLRHPCFDEKAHRLVGRVHLPVAPRCNVLCAYCDRRYPCVNENRPGLARQIIAPEEAVSYVAWALSLEPRIEVVGVAGPGDPLANEETFLALERLRRAYPELKFCLSTNGLLLEERLPQLLELGVEFVTVTVNACSEETAAKLYLSVRYQGQKRSPAFLLEKQRRGLQAASQAGLTLKLNMVLVPGINAHEVEGVARLAAESGVRIMNLIPLIPLGRLASHRPPSTKELRRARSVAARFVPQFLSCKRCRADALGVPGEEPGLCVAC